MAFEFRHATEADIEQIASIEAASMSCPWSADSYKEAVNSDHTFVLVVTEEAAIVGFAVFYLTPPESELPDIVVSEAYRGQGLGRKLLDYSMQELQARAVDTVFLEVRVSNTPARRLYQHFGFEEIGVRKYFYSDPVEDAVCMRLDIDI
ncbi:MAG: ribosomal protein S18-alanine N-acetyltransferase [Pseudobutyrivibrio sp.]|nr:ribosomal protein S18-alanine N-acetyltransferase [Pseudobutyrivibrio sp.]